MHRGLSVYAAASKSWARISNSKDVRQLYSCMCLTSGLPSSLLQLVIANEKTEEGSGLRPGHHDLSARKDGLCQLVWRFDLNLNYARLVRLFY